MNSRDLQSVANALVDAGAPGLPTVVLAREVPLYEVEFAALEFADEAKLAAGDWAVLALGRALGEVSPADVDAYLGLGDSVSEGLLRRLLDEALLQERAAGAGDAAPPPAETGVGAFLRRLLGTGAARVDVPAPAGRATTLARRLHDSRAPATPACTLSAGGVQALERGVLAQRRVRPARLLFLGEPLLYLDTIDERRHRFTQHRRPRPLEPDRVPPSLSVLDFTLGLPPGDRARLCGIGDTLGAFTGTLVGIVPGAQWEVRPFMPGPRGRQGVAESQSALLIVAAFPSTDSEGVRWRTYVRQQDRVQDCPHLDPVRVLDPALRSLAGLLAAIKGGEPEVPLPTALRADGAFGLRCDEAALPRFLGESDRPCDAFLLAAVPGWWVGLRGHAHPADTAAARAAFYEFLGRRDAELRRNFDATCLAVAAGLREYWGGHAILPSADEAAQHLWTRPDLRAALCMRRLRRDLVEPYLASEVR